VSAPATATAPFAARLADSVRARGSRVCLGIDPRPEGHALTHPDRLGSAAAVADAVVAYYRAVLDGCADVVACVKPQSAFFEALGLPGLEALARLLAAARALGLPTVLDAKRGDIGSTAEAYARAYLGDGDLAADALTVSPYLGFDTLEPFITAATANDRGLFVLVATSNPGAGALQDLVTSDGRRVFEHVTDALADAGRRLAPGGGYGPVGAVVGATRGARLGEVRARLPQGWLLVPGFGAQGGAAADVASAFDDSGLGAVVNSSRGLTAPPETSDLATVAREARRRALAMREALDRAITARAASG
jgi:orotidine-5'-phosphate decarboxylase